MLTEGLNDVSDLCNDEVALLIQGLMSLIEFSCDALHGLYFFDGKAHISSFCPKFTSSLEQPVVLLLLD